MYKFFFFSPPIINNVATSSLFSPVNYYYTPVHSRVSCSQLSARPFPVYGHVRFSPIPIVMFNENRVYYVNMIFF